MSVFEPMTLDGYEQVVFCHDKASGLRSIVAIHDTTLGPALGGVRMWPYESELEALRDCLRLAKGMTYKAAGAGVNFGGGKSVIIGDPNVDKTEALLRAHGRFIQTLGGRYIPGIDIGTEMADLEVIGTETDLVSCVGQDPSPMTALGVLSGIRACLDEVAGSTKLDGLKVAVQGVGHVGSALARMLAAEGARLVLADVSQERAEAVAAELGGDVVPSDAITGVECDVFAPCAMGAVVNDATLPTLKCRIIAGSANNVLNEPKHDDALHQAGILYAPDYYVNAGGLVLLEEEMLGHDLERRERRVLGVGTNVARVIARAKELSLPTGQVADMMAEERLQLRARIGPAFVARPR